MKNKTLNRTRLVITSLLTTTILALMILTLLVQVNFDIRYFDWFGFTFNITNFITGRAIYFPIGLDLEQQNEDYALITNTLKKYRNLIIQKKISKEFRLKLELHNTISKCEAYLDSLDYKLSNPKISIKQIEKIEALKTEVSAYIAFLNGKSDKYEGKFKIDGIRIKHDNTTFANMFNFGVGNRSIGEKYVSRVYWAGIKYTLPTFIFTTTMSFFNAIMVFSEYGINAESIFMFTIRMLLFFYGCYEGVLTGKRAIKEEQYPVMLNLTTLAKEIITELENELKVVIDGEPLVIPKQTELKTN